MKTSLELKSEHHEKINNLLSKLLAIGIRSNRSDIIRIAIEMLDPESVGPYIRKCLVEKIVALDATVTDR